MEWDRATIETLAPAIDAARQVLRRKDDDDVPAQLVRVARSSARNLPPPLAKALLDALDTDEEFRDEVASGVPDDGPAAWFLRRPKGWDDLLEAAAGERADRRTARELTRLRSALADAEDARKAAAGRLERERRRTREAEDRLAALLEADRQEVEAVTGDLRSRLAAAVADADRLRADVAATHEEVLALRRRLEAARTPKRTRRSGSEVAARSSGGWSGDAITLATHIDEVAASARARIDASGRVPVVEVAPDPARARGPALPPGVRPDGAEAVDAVLTWSGTVYVDGYNLSGALGADPGDPPSGRRLVAGVVSRMRRRSGGSVDVVVVYDSTTGGGRYGDEVFVLDADAELRRVAGLDPGGTVVVSDDREVIAGVAAAGATAIWSAAVVEWASR